MKIILLIIITEINDKNSPEKDKKEYYNVKLKKSQYKRLKIISEELEEINKNEWKRDRQSKKDNTIKNSLIF